MECIKDKCEYYNGIRKIGIPQTEYIDCELSGSAFSGIDIIKTNVCVVTNEIEKCKERIKSHHKTLSDLKDLQDKIQSKR